METEKIYTPPFKTQGIKTKLIPLIKKNACIDSSQLWIEPFMGSGVVGLNVAPKRAVFADLNPHIVNFYRKLKSRELNTSIVAEYLMEQGALLSERGEDHYYFIREKFNNECDPLDFLFLNRSCFNGMIRFNRKNEFNVPYGHKPQRFSKAYITKILNQVRHFEEMIRNNDWDFYCQSFEDTITLANEDSFIYCDPPYIGRHVDYFDSWDENQETKLHECLSSSQARFMLSTWKSNQYRSNPYVDTLWGSCYAATQEHYYFVGAREENRNAMTEALLTNYPMTGSENLMLSLQSTFEQLAISL